MIELIFAIVAGILTVAAPCILPVLPIILGTSVGQTSKTRPLFIVCGFILAFSVAAIFISFLIQHIGLSPNALHTAGVVVLLLFGLSLVWSKPFDRLMVGLTPFFSRVSMAGGMGSGNSGALVLGLTLGVVWTPCAGPVLGSILTLIALQKAVGAAAVLLVAYAIGASVPMLALAYGSQYVTTRIVSVARYAKALQVVFGIIILLLAGAIYFNYDTQLYALILQHYPNLSPQF